MSEQLNFSKSRWNGWNGNECVFKKEYHKAIEFYNRAIELYPLEYRYFVNRSYCFDQLKQFDSALEDAQRALKLQADWGKCYYRKARALKGLKRLEESKLCFLKVIQLEGNNCREAQEELRTLRQLQTTSSLITQTIGSDSSLNTKTITDENKSDHNSKEEEIKVKKSNRNSMKNSVSSKSNTNGSEKSTIDSNKVQTIVGSESKNTKLIVSNWREKNILKELSDLLLNKKVLPFNPSLNIQSFNTNCVTSEQKCVIDDNKSLKSISNESKTSIESKTKNNKRNSRKGMDEIVEIWDDSRNHWPSSSSNRSPQNIGPSKSFRKIELTNPWKFKGLYITNIIPSEETKQMLRNILNEFGKVTLIDVIPESETALINFDNCESPRMAMSQLQGVYMPKICVNNQKLRIKFRPLNDSKNYPSIHYISEVQFNNECYFWRTTGCNYTRCCKLKHIPVNKGVDLQPWMQQNNKIRYKRQNRNRFEVIK